MPPDTSSSSPRRLQPRGDKLAAVVYNPAKHADEADFRRRVGTALARRGWKEPLWLPTTADDPGVSMTRHAIDRQVSLVLGSGGDGTMRVICSQLAGTGIPLGLLPAGTGNLLARNLAIPLDESAALETALDGVPRAIDLIKVTIDGHEDKAEHFGVMAGIGFDARLMSNTSEKLKRVVGAGAYVVAFARELGAKPQRVRVRLDDQPEFQRKAVLTVLGNVSSIQGGVALLPDAKPADGLMDLLIANPSGAHGWLRLFGQLLARIRRSEQMEQFQASRITIRLDHPTQYEFDGDTLGKATIFAAEVQPGALTIMLPDTTRTEELSEAADVLGP